MKFLAALFLLILVSTAYAATVTNSMSLEGNCAVNRNLDVNWQSGVSNDSIGGNSGSSILTAPGPLQYQTKDTVDATYNNFYNQTGYTRFDNGGLYTESVNMETTDPYQSVTIEHSGILQSTQIDTAKFVENADVDMGQQIEWDGAGFVTRDVKYTVDQVRDSMDNTYYYRTGSTDHTFVSTNSTGGARFRPEFSFSDFSNSFITNDTILSINATENQTEEIKSVHVGAI